MKRALIVGGWVVAFIVAILIGATIGCVKEDCMWISEFTKICH